MDDARGEALLRSDAPATKGERVAYYEVRLQRPRPRRGAAVRGGPHRERREQVAFALTHEVLAKLAGDIAG